MKEITKIDLLELAQMSEKMYEPLVKGVVDIEKGVLVLDAGLHADEELYLLERGSAQGNLWGINLWPQAFGTDKFIEFDSMINIRPAQGNRTRSVEDPAIQERIRAIIAEKVDG